MLNWKKDPELVLIALVEMEGTDFIDKQEWNPEAEYSWFTALRIAKQQVKRIGTTDFDGYVLKEEDVGSAIVYGLGGWNRYYLRPNGTIGFSKSHNKDYKVRSKAHKLGFDL